MIREDGDALLTALSQLERRVEKIEAANAPMRLFDLVYRERRLRDHMFDNPGLFADPAWDILLGLARSELAQRPTSISAAAVDSCVPHTTALRWIENLKAEGMIAIDPDQRDGRRKFVRLTEPTWTKLRDYAGAATKLRQAG